MQAASYSESASERNAFFVTVAYRNLSDGQVVCDIPSHCPLGADGSSCSVRVHGKRERKCGPGHPLFIAVCSKHRHYFTLYPLGWVPYSRKAVVPNAPKEAPTPPSLTDWRDTWVGKVVPLAEGEPRVCHGCFGNPDTRQIRREVVRAGRLCGLSAEPRLAEQLALDIGVGLHAIHQARQRFTAGRSWQARATAVAAVLGAIPPDRTRLARVLRAGARAKLWSPPWMWTASLGYQALF